MSLHRALPLIRAELDRLAETQSAPPRSLARADREGGSRPALPFPTVLHPIRMMETEHVRIEVALDCLRQATHALVAGEGAPEGWRHCLSELSRLDSELRAHHRAENEVLFPRALELERRLP